MAVRISAEVTVTDQNDAESIVCWYLRTTGSVQPPAPATTQTSQPVGAWTRTEPAVESASDLASYVWSVWQINWGDGTCDWGEVSLSASFEAAKLNWNYTSSVEATADEAASMLRYAHTHEVVNGEFVFEATLWRGARDVTEEADADRFVWFLRDEGGEAFLGRGRTMRVAAADAGYRASVVGGYEDAGEFADAALVTDGGDAIVTDGGDALSARMVWED